MNQLELTDQPQLTEPDTLVHFVHLPCQADAARYLTGCMLEVDPLDRTTAEGDCIVCRAVVECPVCGQPLRPVGGP